METNINSLTNVADYSPVGASNVERLRNNKSSEKMQRLFGKLPTDDINLTPDALSKAEVRGSDSRLDDYDESLNLINRFDALQRNLERKRGKGYASLDYIARRDKLRALASNDYVADVLKKLTNEIIVIEDKQNKCCEIKVDVEELKEYGFSEATINKIEKSIADSFPKIYRMLGMYNSGAWKYCKRWITEGRLSWQVIFDDVNNPKKILGFLPIDGFGLIAHYKRGVRYWQYNYFDRVTNKKEKNIFYDHQVIYVDWSEVNEDDRMSYAEQLYRSYNMLKTIEEVKLIYAVSNAPYRMQITVPTRGMSRKHANQTIVEEKTRMHDDYHFDPESGQILVNGTSTMPVTREYWAGEGENGKPEFTSIGNDGPDLSNLEKDEYFLKKFYRASGIPRSRFDDESTETWSVDVTSAYRYELAFARDISRIRETYGKIYLQPVITQLILDVPELKDNSQVIDAIFIEWSSYSKFVELMEMEIQQSIFKNISEISEGLKVKGADGEGIPFIPITHLLKKYANYTDTDIAEIEKERLVDLERALKEEAKRQELISKYKIPIDPMNPELSDEKNNKW